MLHTMLGCKAHLKNQSKCILQSLLIHVNIDNSYILSSMFLRHAWNALTTTEERVWNGPLKRELFTPVKALCWLAESNGRPGETFPSGRIDWDVGQTRLLWFYLQGSAVCLVIVEETVCVQQIICYLDKSETKSAC